MRDPDPQITDSPIHRFTDSRIRRFAIPSAIRDQGFPISD